MHGITSLRPLTIKKPVNARRMSINESDLGQSLFRLIKILTS
jgi:hypothetical protein